MKMTDSQSDRLIDKILNSRKYRETGLNPSTIENLIAQEAPNHATEKELLKSVRRKLHNIVAPYLGEPDYQALTSQLDQIQDASLNSSELRVF
jgi:16S rRNA (guanine(1405)-N(7))-methyltransferase